MVSGVASGTAALLRELAERAMAEVGTVLSAAEDESSRIRAEAQRRCDELRTAALAACDEECSARRDAALGEARIGGRRAVLVAQHAAVDRVLTETAHVAANRNAWGIPPNDAIAGRLDELLSYVGGAAVEVHCALDLYQPLVALLAMRNHELPDPGPLVPSPQSPRICPDAAIAVGVRAIGEGGRVVVDDTFEAWVTHERSRLAIEICREIATDRPHA